MKSNVPVLSFLSHTRIGTSRKPGFTLIELSITITLAAVLAGFLLLTVANYASNIKLKNYANQIASAVQIQKQTKVSFGSPKVTASELETSLKTLLDGSADFVTANFGSTVNTAAKCGTNATGVELVTSSNLDATDTTQLADFIEIAVEKVFDGAAPGGTFNDVFKDGDSTDGGFNDVKTASQNIYLCFENTA